MPILLTQADVVKQSKEVYGQFGEKWKRYTKINVRLPHKDSWSLLGVGVGKTLVCAALGESMEIQIESLRKNQHKVDILTCEKGFGILMEQGIKPKHVMICDSNVPYRWGEKYINETDGVNLICTPYANVEWTTKWKGDLYFYTSKDAIQTEQIFCDIMGEETRMIPASSNVSNAMLVFMLGVDNTHPHNFSGYEQYLLVGYDYGWRPNGNYYAFANPKPKRHYMQHRTMIDMKGEAFFSSENLIFSGRWLYSYLTTFTVPVINCSDRGLLGLPDKLSPAGRLYTGLSTLEKELEAIKYDPRMVEVVKQKMEGMQSASEALDIAKKEFNKSKEGLYYDSR